MKRDDTFRVIHGMRLFLPPTWENTSIYRFNAPVGEAEGAGAEQRLQPNLLVSRHLKQPGHSADRFLELSNLEAKKADKTFEVLRSGTVSFLDQICEWQDARFTDPRTGVVVHQRRVVAPTWPRHFTLLSLSGTAADIEQMSAEIGLEQLSLPPQGVKVGGVLGTLIAGPKHSAKK
jgi:hypothetical protein